MIHKSFKVSKKFISPVVVLLILAIPVAVQSAETVQAQQSSEYVQGRLAGEQAAKGNPIWFLGGLLCGVFAVIYCYIQSATPPAMALVGKSAEYVMGYSDGYKKKRGRDAVYAWIGWGVWIAIVVAVAGAGSDSDSYNYY